MSKRTDGLRALARDPAATPGEKAAALKALAIHEALSSSPTPQRATAPVQAPPQQEPTGLVARCAPIPDSSGPALLLFEGGLWTLDLDHVIVGSWAGDCAVTIEYPEIRSYLGYVVNQREYVEIDARLKCDWDAVHYFERFVHNYRGFLTVVTSGRRAGDAMYQDAICTKITYECRNDDRLISIEIKIEGRHRSAAYDRATRLALASPALPAATPALPPSV